MAKKNLFKITLALVMALMMCFNTVAVSAHGPGHGGSMGGGYEYDPWWDYNEEGKKLQLGWMYAPGTEGSATVLADDSNWVGNLTMEIGHSVTIIPAEGYRVARVDMLCTGKDNKDEPLDCRTYNENKSFKIVPDVGTANLFISNLTSSSCSHSSDSTQYYLMITLEETDMTVTYNVTYTPGTGVGESFTDPNAYTFSQVVTVADPGSLGYYKQGAVFAGWEVTACSDPNPNYNLVGNTYSAGKTFGMPAGNVTLTAIWEIPEVPVYTVTYVYEGDIPTGYIAPTDTNAYEAGASVTVAPTPVIPEGYTFSGWDTENFLMPAENVVITGVWEFNPEYSVTYVYEGDIPEGYTAPVDSNTYAEGESVTVAPTPVIPEGYTFSGWDTEDFAMPGKDVVITGEWTKLPTYDYTLTYVANNGTDETAVDSESKTHTYNTSATIEIDEK